MSEQCERKNDRTSARPITRCVYSLIIELTLQGCASGILVLFSAGEAFIEDGDGAPHLELEWARFALANESLRLLIHRLHAFQLLFVFRVDEKLARSAIFQQTNATLFLSWGRGVMEEEICYRISQTEFGQWMRSR